MEQIRKTPVGVLLLWIIALGLLALAIWQIAEAFLERNPDTKKKWGYRIKYVGTAIAYSRSRGRPSSTHSAASRIRPSRRRRSARSCWRRPGECSCSASSASIVGAIGVAFIVRGLTRGFEKHLALPPGDAKKGIVTFGVVGYVAKGIAIAVTGVLFVVAAVTHDPNKAGGLDAALHSLAALPFGADHPVDRGSRTRDLRHLLLRPRTLRQDVRAPRPTA